MANFDGINFPSEIDIKVFTRAVDEFEEQLKELLKKYMLEHQILGIRQKQSAKGKYHSFSCKVQVLSRNEIDQLFAALSNHPDIVMVI